MIQKDDGLSSIEMKSLKICTDLFQKLAQKNVIYCHWKSNRHLSLGLMGHTDLDLLIHAKDRKVFDFALNELGFKRIVCTPENKLPGMEDYLGFDEDTGSLCHLHVHYKLILGQKYIKNHHLPIEQFILENRRKMQGVYVPIPEIELLILIIRANLKFDILSLIFRNKTKHCQFFPDTIYDEFEFLLKDYNPGKFNLIVEASGLPLSAYRLGLFLEKIQTKSLSFRDILHMRSYLHARLKRFQRRNNLFLGNIYISFFSSSAIYAKKRFFGEKKKTLPGGGKIIALVGADGSGKSTLAKDLSSWLSWKVETQKVYFGIPKTVFYNAFSYLILILCIPARLNSISQDERCIHFINILINTLKARRWIWVAKHRLSNYSRSLKKSAGGEIVIADRYPLREFWSMSEPMDGPRIRRELKGRKCGLAEKEENIYRQIGEPFRIIVLKTDIQKLRSRKQDIDFDLHKEKSKAVNSLVELDSIRVIDANRCYRTVVLDIKKKIWEAL
jgi:hypothetical protein